MKRLYRPYGFFCAALLAMLGLVVSCNEDSTTTLPGYTPTQSLGVTSFKLQANAKVMKDLDSVFFSIDLNRGVIYNADSLPMGTNVSALRATITFSASDNVKAASIVMNGGSHRTGTIDYKKSPNDTIDFTGDVVLQLTAQDGMKRDYTLKVNVHKQVPDSMMWTSLAKSLLPSRMANPVEQRTVAYNQDGAVTLVKESDGTYTVAECSNLADPDWTKKATSFNFTPRVRSLHAFGSRLVMLDEGGSLCVSDDKGATWSMANHQVESIVGVFADQLIVVEKADARKIVALNQQFGVASSIDMPTGFPVSGRSDLRSFTTKWAAEPIAILFGGVKDDGTLSNDVWGYDGINWSVISNVAPPAMKDAQIVPYYIYRKTTSAWIQTEYSAWMLIGGRKADGSINRDIYISNDNGVSFVMGKSLIQLPASIDPVYSADALVASTPMTANLNSAWKEPKSASPLRIKYDVDGSEVTWQCPFIYLIGGHTSAGALRTDMLRGVLARLTYAPLF